MIFLISKSDWRYAGRNVGSFESRLVQVGQASPYPFKWSEQEIPHPDMTKDDLEKPNTSHHIISLIAL